MTTPQYDCHSSLLWMIEQSRTYGIAIAGSLVIIDDGKAYNRLYFVKPDGTYVSYDKRHLFTYGGEDRRYTPGHSRTTVEWGGVTFLLQICYDLRFPCFSRNSSDDAHRYDAAIYVANWPQSRRSVWDTLLRARALENQCYVLGVNRIGDDTACHYNGGTAIIDAYGKDVARANDDAPDIITATLDIGKLRSFRKKFPVLNDADR